MSRRASPRAARRRQQHTDEIARPRAHGRPLQRAQEPARDEAAHNRRRPDHIEQVSIEFYTVVSNSGSTLNRMKTIAIAE